MSPAESIETDQARADAVRVLEAEFSELFTHVRRLIAENANRVSPGLLPGAYKALTTIASCAQVTSSGLAERLQMDKGQVSRMVRELEELGLVERSPDPRDGRSSLLALTAHGVERLAAARAPQEGILLRSVQDWSLADIASLSRLLHALASGTNPA